MNREIFESEIEQIIDKYSDIESVVEIIGDDVITELTNELYEEYDDEPSGIEKKFLQKLDNKICKQENQTILQTYFNDVGNIYDKQGDEEIEFCEKNREKIINSNLKFVVSIAKSYRGMGVEFEDLISAGNEGLCIAFDKYKPNEKIELRNRLLEQLNSMENVNIQWIKDNIKDCCKYGSLKKNYNNFFKKDVYTKDEVINWVNKYIKPASFNSVSMFWIKAWIRSEISKNSKLIKNPNPKNSEEKHTYYSLGSQSLSDKNNLLFEETLITNNESVTNIDLNDSYKIFYDKLRLMFEGLDMKHRSVVMQRFGIGLLRPLKPVEIADRMNSSKARISQILRYSLDVMKNNAEKYNINSGQLYEILEKCKEIF